MIVDVRVAGLKLFRKSKISVRTQNIPRVVLDMTDFLYFDDGHRKIEPFSSWEFSLLCNLIRQSSCGKSGCF